jgi:hypothetical protein
MARLDRPVHPSGPSALPASILAAPPHKLRLAVGYPDYRCALGDAIIALVALVISTVRAGDHEETSRSVASAGP